MNFKRQVLQFRDEGLHRIWLENECSCRRAAEVSGYSITTVSEAVKAMGSKPSRKFKRGPIWDRDMLDALHKGYATGQRQIDLAEHIGVSEKQLRCKAKELGLVKIKWG